MALDPRTSAIRALVGGFDFGKNKINHVTRAWRQPGSSFKPFIYSAALEKGFTPATVVNDAPLFFDADTTASDGARIDHVGMYMGLDNAGKRRFISSRKSINGATMADYKGSSLLDKFVKKSRTNIYEPVLYTKAFRAARRL